ncbi:M23 family metallopeptidase [bacterium]|nr:M23 family metallopeptidase [bacterium]MBU1883429.1 M23 family metallopeptidase [bacterium]
MRVVLFLLFLLLGSLFASDDTVLVKAKKVGEYVIVDGVNKNPFSVTVSYNASYQNLKSDKKMPMLFVLNPLMKREVLRLHIEKKGFVLKANYTWTIGSKDAKHDNNYIYRLPYKLGTKRRVAQGFNGKFTHYGMSQYAVDFEMPVGTEVYAAREGRVVKTKDDSNIGGVTRSFEKYANYIIIEHNDGTLASYVHLKQYGVVVEEGDQVDRGQLIGYSGITGLTKGPHLHFIVYRAVNGTTRDSFPIKFMSARGIVTEPVTGKWYVAK